MTAALLKPSRTDRRLSEKAIQILDSWMPPAVCQNPDAIRRLWHEPRSVHSVVRRGKVRIIRTIDQPRIQAYAIGQRVRELRLRLGLLQEDLAKRTGIARPNITRIERGAHLPSMKTLRRLAETFGVSIGSLLEKPTPIPRREQRALAEAGLRDWIDQLDQEDRR